MEMRTLEPRKVMFTYSDYMTLPDDGKRYEILGGDLHMTPAPLTNHQIVAFNLGHLLWQHIKEHDLGRILEAPTDVVFSRTSIVQPDLMFIAKDRLKIITRRNVRGAPNLIVEVLSRQTARVDRGRKWKMYARYGVRHYWLVDPDAHTLEAYELRGGEYKRVGTYIEDDIFSPSLFPGLALPLKEVWA